MTRVSLLAAGVVAAFAPATAWATCATMPTLCGLPVTSTIEEPDLDEAVDIVLVGDGFTTATAWDTAAAAAIATFKAQSASGVYGTVPGIYNFHVVQVLSATNDVFDADLTDTALGMNVAGPYITADGSRVATAALNAPDVDIVIAIGAGSGRANANYPGQLVSGGNVRLGSDASPISHELGHAGFHLADEYVEAANCQSAAGESALITERNVTKDPTCAKFGTTPGAGCVEGGKYCATGVYRSAGSCLMATSGNSATCPVCARTLREMLLEKHTGLDHAEPWAVPTAPANGTTVSGKINLAAMLYDDYFAPTTVAYAIDGVLRGSQVATSTFSFVELDTTLLADGMHSLKVFPDDVVGHAGRSTTVTFQTLNASVSAPTTLTVQYPMNGQVVQGKTFINGSASDPTPAWLALLVDGAPVAMVIESKNISMQWDTTTLTNGPHTLELKAADHLQALYSSPVVNVTVAQSTDGGSGGGTVGGQGIFIFAPTAWSAVGPSFLLRFSGASGAMYEVWVDGVRVLMQPLPPAGSGPEGSAVTTLIDSSGWSLGPHAVEVRTATAVSRPQPVVRVAPGVKPVAFITAPSPGAYRGTVSVAAVGYDDVSVASLSLLVDGVSVSTQAGAAATFNWVTGAVTDGQHVLKVRALDGAGNTGDSEAVQLLVDNTPPTVSITSPANGATMPSNLAPVMLAAADNDSIARVELLVDAAVAITLTPLAGANPVAVPATLTVGNHTLQARVFDRAGNSAMSTVRTVTAGNCTAPACDDGVACTVDSCGTSGACVNVKTAGCCATVADCNDGDPCTTDACGGTLTCSNTPIAGCCNHGTACSDGMLCTLDKCSGLGGTCSHPAAGCCAVVGDCDDGNSCTTDSCLAAGWCLHDWNGTCCRTTADCDDHNACTTEVCNAGTCAVTPVAGCCNTSADCNDNVRCTFDQCVNHVCTFTPDVGCCNTPADCTTLNPCETTTCNASFRCQPTPTAACCTFGFECDDRDPCTLDRCTGAACDHVPICCTMPSQCNDGRACTTDSCDTASGKCTFAPVAGCCVSAADCDDLDACTTNTCAAGVCASTAVTGCCHSGADCDDGDACTADSCSGNVCGHAAVTACCTSAAMCDDADVCTTDACTANVCASAPVAGCCHAATECDDADACTDDACTANACTHLTHCCTTATECDDGDACTADACEAGACSRTPIAGCCAGDADCAAEQVCTQARCVPKEMMPPGQVTGGCGCGQASGLGWALAAIAALTRRRRRSTQ